MAKLMALVVLINNRISELLNEFRDAGEERRKQIDGRVAGLKEAILIIEQYLTQGARAVRSGRFGEANLEGSFGVRGVRIVDDHETYHVEEQMFKRDERILIRQFQLRNGGKIDFLYRDYNRGIALPIESKNQMGNGTTDEKLSFTVESMAEAGYGAFWLILSGGQFRKKVVRHIENKIRRINETTNQRGRVIYNVGPVLQRSIEALTEHGIV